MAKKVKVEHRSMTRVTTDGKVLREPIQDSEGPKRYYWWKDVDPEDKKSDYNRVAYEIASTIRFMMDNNPGRNTQLIASTRLYGNSTPFGLLGAAFTRSSSSMPNPSGTRISYNLCSSVIDTIVAQVAKNKVIPMFITSGGTWGLQKKAEQLNKFAEGLFYEQHAHKKYVTQSRDACIWGDGYIQVKRNKEDRVEFVRRVPHELSYDKVEATNGKVRQKHLLYIEDRGVLLNEYPDKEKEINEVNPASYDDLGGAGTAADLVVISESWHLPSGKDAGDGLYVKCLFDTNEVLECKKWERDYFPLIDLKYIDRPIGIEGQGACERLQNLQGEINRLMILDQKSRWLNASFKILSHISDKIPAQHFNNEVGPVLKWSGNIPPSYIAPAPIDPSNEEKINSLIQKGYQQEGVSQLSASNVKPLGIDSGAALRAYDQISEDRQLPFEQRVEDSSLEMLKMAIDEVKEIYKEKGTYKIKYPNAHFMEEIDWADIDLQEEEYWLKAFPTSELPEEPSAKFQTVQEYAQAGYISSRTAQRLLRMPDMEIYEALFNAAEDLICKTIEDIIYEGKDDVVPDGEWDLTLAQEYCLKYLNYAKLHGCPEKRIAMLRDFKSLIDDAIGTSQPPQPQVIQAPANPASTPQSNLIPNVNPQGAA